MKKAHDFTPGMTLISINIIYQNNKLLPYSEAKPLAAAGHQIQLAAAVLLLDSFASLRLIDS